MCLWLITACLGMLPMPPQTSVVVVGLPTPIVQPTTAAPTTAPPPPSSSAATSPPTTPTPALTTTTAPPPATTAPPPATTTPPPTTTTPPPATTAPPPATTTPPPATTAPPPATTTPPPATTTPLPATTAPPPATTAPPPATITTTARPIVTTVTTNPTAGPLPIDPRLGTTPSALAKFQLPNYDMAVKFPREKRSIEDSLSIKDLLLSLSRDSGAYRHKKQEHSRKKRQTTCSCVPNGTCPTVPPTNNGAGLLDVRIVNPGSPCALGQTYCCVNATPPIACGTLQKAPAPSVAPVSGQASFGEYPWQALILSKQNDYIAGGVLIDPLNVLTVTHRLTSYVVSGAAPNLKIRLGEWDAAGTYEPVPFQEYNIAKVFSHPSFNAATLQFDITVLRLAAPVPFTPAAGSAVTINRACLPPSATTTYTGQRCWVSGWGKDMFGLQGQYQQILKKIDVTVVAPATCQTELQAARLGANFVLDTTTFMCAGGEANKDSCTGDGGSGLVCEVNGQWVLVGLVSWGLGCATANVPGVYVNVAALLPWIQQQVATP